MKKIISNSSPLMYLAKIKRLDLLKRLFKEIIIPEEVYNEVVVKGKQEKFTDAFFIENALKDGWIKIKKVKKRKFERLLSEIDIGESAVINLAKETNADLILIDDASARTIAESIGLNVKGTLYVILLAFKNKIINKKEAKSLVDELVFSEFRISSDIYAEIINKINENKDELTNEEAEKMKKNLSEMRKTGFS